MAAPSFNIVNYQANSYIIVEGKKEAYNFFIIREGKVKVSRENPVVGEDPNQVLGPGDFFGEMVLLDELPRSATCRALETTRLHVMYKDHFDLFIVDKSGLNMERLTSARKPNGQWADNESPTFSPDGRFIMFTSNRTGTNQLYIISPDGTNERRITFDKYDYTKPKWSPYLE